MKRLRNLFLMFSAISFAFVGVASAAGPPTGGGWTDDGAWVRLADPSDSVSIGENSASSAEYKLNVKDGAVKLTANDSAINSGRGILQLWNTDAKQNYLSFNNINSGVNMPNSGFFKIGGGCIYW